MLSNNSNDASEMEYNKKDVNLGLALAILSTVFIGASFIIKKKALIKINNQGSIRASAGGFSYLKEWMWWTGFISSAYSLLVTNLNYVTFYEFVIFRLMTY